MPHETLRSAADAVRRVFAHHSDGARRRGAWRGHLGFHTTTHADLRARDAESSR